MKKKNLTIRSMILLVLFFGLITFSAMGEGNNPIEITVRVAVFDYTQNNSIHPMAEIWIKGHGSWWVESELKFGGTVKKVGKKASGVEHVIYFYPSSRDGQEIKIPYEMTKEMNPNGSTRDTINIDIEDEEIIVWGLPIKEATGNIEIIYERK